MCVIHLLVIKKILYYLELVFTLVVVQATGMAPAIKAELLECGKVSASLDAEVSNFHLSQSAGLTLINNKNNKCVF